MFKICYLSSIIQIYDEVHVLRLQVVIFYPADWDQESQAILAPIPGLGLGMAKHMGGAALLHLELLGQASIHMEPSQCLIPLVNM